MTAGLTSGKTFRIPSWMLRGCSESVPIFESLPVYIVYTHAQFYYKDRVLIGSYLHALTWSTLQVIVGEEVSLQVCTHQSLMTLTHGKGNILKTSNLSNTFEVGIFCLHSHAPAGY